MKISELAEETGVPVGTIKFYLREGLLPPGQLTSRTSAEYDLPHVERLRLIRALLEVGGLSIAGIRRIVGVLDETEPSPINVLATAQQVVVVASAKPEPEEPPTDRARRWVEERGWFAPEGDPILHRLARAWDACDSVDLGIGEDDIDVYADAMRMVAEKELSSVPRDADDAVRLVVLGTVLADPLLSALRLLAQRQVARESRGGAPVRP